MSVYMPKINYILLIYRNLFLTPIHASKLLLLNSLMEFLGTNTDIHKIKLLRQQNIFSSRRKFRAFSIGDKRLSLKVSGRFVTKE